MPQTELEVVGKSDGSGTTITFYPDPTIFMSTVNFDTIMVVNYLRHQAYLTKGIHTSVIDERANWRTKSFHF